MAVDIVWLGCDVVSGQIIEELADLRATGPLRRLLGEDQSMQFTLPLPKLGSHGSPPPNWEAATQAGRTMLVAVLNGNPVWAGIVLIRQGGSAALLTLSTVTCEGYLDHRYVTDHKWVQKDESSVIAAGLLKDAATEGIGLVIDAPPTGRKRDREYFTKENKSVKSAMAELAGVLDGIEWTVDLEWATADQTAVRKVARVRKRIGVAGPAGGPVATFSAAAVFDTAAGTDARYTYTEDYSTGSGGNHIVAWSTGAGSDMPFSTPARDEELLDSGFPRFEERFQPSTSIIETATLDEHARERLALVGRGIVALELQARADVYPRLGDDWRLGDVVGYDVVGHWHRQGLQGQARAVGWELDPQQGVVAPILLTPPGGFASPEVANWVENGSFEEDTLGWLPGGTVQPTMTRSSARAHHGGWSLLVTWNTGAATNLLPNPGFDAAVTGWTQLSGWQSIARVTSPVRTAPGAIAATMTAAASGRWMAFLTTPDAGAIAIIAGELYVASGWLRAATVGRSARLRLAWYTTAGVYLPGEDDYGTLIADVTGAWTQASVQGVAPPTAGRVALEVRWGDAGDWPANAEVHYGDDFFLGISGAGSFPQVQTTLDNLVPGTRYNASAWVFVPGGGRPVQLAVGGIGQGAASSGQGTWEQLSYSFVATATSHSLQLWPIGPVLGGEQVYLDEVEVFGT